VKRWRAIRWQHTTQFNKFDARSRYTRVLNDLTARLSERDRELGEVTIAHPCVVGIYDGARCIAAASYIYHGEAVADVGV
jgi:hypothetical protein